MNGAPGLTLRQGIVLWSEEDMTEMRLVEEEIQQC